MKLNMISKAASAVIVLSAVCGNVFAAESAAGVKEHMGLTLASVKEAQAAAAAGDKAGCLAAIKKAKQHYKEVTGDAAGKPLQDAIKELKVGQAECDEGDTAKAATTLSGVVSAIDKINSSIK